MSALGEGFRLALGTFTRIPSGEVSTERAVARAALLLAPLAVLPLAVGVGLLGWSVEAGVPPWVAAGLALALLAYGTRAMHLDGLADTVDGLGAGWDRERALEVMRRGDLGPMGAVALVLALLLQAAAMAELFTAGWRGGLVVAALVVASRATCALLCAAGSRPSEGSSLGRVFVGAVPVAAAVGLQVVTALVVLAAAWPLVDGPGALLLGGSTTAVAALAVLALAGRARRVLGGVNGDVLGAGVEISLAASLVVGSVTW